MIIVLLALTLLIALALVYFTWLAFITLSGLINGRPPSIGTRREVLPQIIAVLNLKNNSVLYDLGCGDGRVLLAAYESAPRSKLLGFDTNQLILLRSNIKKRLKKAKITLSHQSFFKTDLSPATHVFCYLSKATMAKLEPKFVQELSVGTRLVSLDYPLVQHSPTSEIKLGDGRKLGKVLYIYDF